MRDPVNVGLTFFVVVGIGGTIVGFFTPLVGPFEVFMTVGVFTGICAYAAVKLHNDKQSGGD